MNERQFQKGLIRIHELFSENEKHLNTLSDGIKNDGPQRDILDQFLEEIGLEKNDETYYCAAERIGNKKFEPLQVYLQGKGVDQIRQDEIFESSYDFVKDYYEKLQSTLLQTLREEQVLPEFYQVFLEHSHEIGKLHSDLFLKWNRKLLFETNRELETRFDNDHDAILAHLESEKLFDIGHHGEKADRSYSILQKQGEGYISQTYAQIFPKEIGDILQKYDEMIDSLSELDDKVYDAKESYIAYFRALQEAYGETDPNNCVEKWSQVDIAWMAIQTPIQPGHPIEYYEDRYRQAVSIEFDVRIVDPSLFQSQVKKDIENMYEGMYDEIGRENFEESYHTSKKNLDNVGLYIGAPVLAYGSFFCTSYSAQVIPNDDEVSQVHGKKIFAFPKFVLDSQRAAKKMKLDQLVLSDDMRESYDSFLEKDDERYYKIYDIETIGHEFGHTLWLTPGCEVRIGASGQYKNIEEFKATAGGLVAHFLKGPSDLDEDIVLTHTMRAIKIMKYREVEDILPYYCECLIHLHILYESGVLYFEEGKAQLDMSSENLEKLRQNYTGVYTAEIFTYLNQMDAKGFLLEYTQREDSGVFLPKIEELRDFVENYYTLYKKYGNTLADD